LVQQRLEDVMVAPIEQRHLDGKIAKGTGSIQTAEAATNNHHAHVTTILDLDGTTLAHAMVMTIAHRLASWGGARLSRRVSRSLPWVGAAIAAATVASTMRRKGVISGALDTGLNAVPLVGAAKNIIEVVRGRDFFPDRYGPGVLPPRT